MTATEKCKYNSKMATNCQYMEQSVLKFKGPQIAGFSKCNFPVGFEQQYLHKKVK